MNRQALYVWDGRGNRVVGPFHDLAAAEAHAGDDKTITRLTGNEILRARIKVSAPKVAP